MSEMRGKNICLVKNETYICNDMAKSLKGQHKKSECGRSMRKSKKKLNQYNKEIKRN